MIKTKRDSLEQFIRSQMEGPEACNGRFSFIGDTSCVDVINTTPGSLYSTAVLFPKKDIEKNINEVTLFSNAEEDNSLLAQTDIESDETNNESETDADIDEKHTILSSSDEDDLYSLSQRFPNTIGISCCINPTSNTNKDLKIVISGRYYRKITKENFCKVLVLIKTEYNLFQSFFTNYKDKIAPYFQLKENGVTTHNFSAKDYQNVKQLLLEINLELCEKIAKLGNGDLDPTYLKIKKEYRYLKSYKEKLWHKLNVIQDSGETYLEESEKNATINCIKQVERHETFLSYLEDASSLYNSKSFGYWVAESFSSEIDLTDIDLNISSNKRIFSPHNYPALKDVVKFSFDENDSKDDVKQSSDENNKQRPFASLSVWLQVTKNSRQKDDPKLYLKVQLENSSTPFKETPVRYFSIVTEGINQRSFFGVQIEVNSPDLIPYRQSADNKNVDNDIEQLNYLYRSINDYGIGHLCSVDWDIDGDNKCVRSEFIPSFETPDVEPIPRDKYSEYTLEGNELVPKQLLEDTKAIEFKWLSIFSDASDNHIIEKLLSFVDAYGTWIQKLRAIDTKDQNAQVNLDLCQSDYIRMRSNIELLLKDNPINIESFRLMNAAMFIQLWHSKNNTNQITTIEFYKNADDKLFGNFSATWRPFQIAFVLLNLDGIFQRTDDPTWIARNELVDLVWFPTGGGKTEAYLGIIALTIINRRRTENKEQSGGTTAIMRYTLRLLATQQFQRAMRVILALEQLRLYEKTKLGESPITIGLYVGDDSLPNGAKDLLDECEKWTSHQESKIPLTKCPWCGSKLEFQNTTTRNNPKIIFRCENIRCTFSDELPIILCDEDIYSTPPTLLFGTVDKFAALGHKVSTAKENKDSRRIFGKGKLNNLPPDLIIQDELHLLLGPLGSAVSLFESAVDQLCSYQKTLADGSQIIVRPKIISSTATTRNTELQIRALYDRDVNIFPKSGIDYDDSFFAFFKRKKVGEKVEFIAKRKYLGILPTGRTQMTTQMRLIATMFVHRALFEQEYSEQLTDNQVIDAMNYYHSIIAYFNSLKEVGKTDAQFYTEFTKYTRRLLKRVLRNSNMLECFYGYDSSFRKSELTGRLSGAEVVEQLDIVSQKWNPEHRLPYKNTEETKYHRGETPPDLILATNMISVGLDVGRFNTIVMNSMPRNIAEYIQASSRVAREKLGLVVTLHNPFRSRDLSHFERFREFHEKLYYYVEPISITPFSKKSIEKYLPLYLATLIRHKYDTLADDQSASSLDHNLVKRIKVDLSAYFEERLNRTKALAENQRGLLTDELKQNIDDFIEQALNSWLGLVNGGAVENYSLRYSGADYINNRRGRGQTKHKDLFLSLDAYEEDPERNLWAVPMSLRNVESEAVISINDKGEKNGNI